MSTSRSAELAAKFAASKQATHTYAAQRADERKEIVAEMLTFMSRREVAEALGVTRVRVSQLADGRK